MDHSLQNGEITTPFALETRGVHLLLVHQAIGSVLREVQQGQVTIPSLLRKDYATRRKPNIDWADDILRHQLLDELVTDACTLVATLEKQLELPEKLEQKLELLRTVIQQDIETASNESASVRKVQDSTSGQASEGMAAIEPIQPSTYPQRRFGKADFIIDTDAHTITCPEGHTVSYKPKKPRRNTRPDQVVYVNRPYCKDCLLRIQCLNDAGSRSIRVSL